MKLWWNRWNRQLDSPFHHHRVERLLSVTHEVPVGSFMTIPHCMIMNISCTNDSRISPVKYFNDIPPYEISYSLVMSNIAIENGPVEIVSFPINSMVDLSIVFCGIPPAPWESSHLAGLFGHGPRFDDGPEGPVSRRAIMARWKSQKTWQDYPMISMYK